VVSLRLRRLASLCAVLNQKGLPRPLFVTRVVVALLFGRDALGEDLWRARGLDLEAGVSVVLGVREADSRWPCGLALATAEPAATLRWLAAEGVTPVVEDRVVRFGVEALAAAAADRLFVQPPSPELLAHLEATLAGSALSAALDTSGDLRARVRLPGVSGESDAFLSGLLAVPSVRSSRVVGIHMRDHVLVARGDTTLRALTLGAPVLLGGKDAKPLEPTDDRRKLAAILSAVPWPAPWHAHPLRRILRLS
jgi:hypothetical protein